MAVKSSSVLSQLNLAKRSMQILQDDINREQTGTPTYKKLVADYNDLQIKISNLTNQYQDLKSVEKNINKVDAAKKKIDNLKTQISSLEEAKKRSSDVGQSTASLDTQIEKLKGELKKSREVVTKTDVTPNYVPPKVDSQGKAVLPKLKDSDKDGIPDSLDTEPNTPAEKPAESKKPVVVGTPPKSEKPPVVVTPPKVVTPPIDTANKEATGLNAADALGLASTLFEHVDSLKALLKQYLDPKLGWTDARFLQELRNDPWYKKNSKEIKTRYIQLYNYQDLVKSGQADGTTNYEKEIQTLKDQVLKKAREMGSGLASDPAKIQQVAENMYITDTGIDDMFTTQLIAAAIRPIGSTISGKPTEGYSGKALENYQALQSIAKSNGFTMADIIPGGSNEQQVLQGIATGAIDVNRIAQDARRLAAQGQPQYVRDLLGQGYNLDQVYAPYRQTMANILEIDDPNQISLNDPTLRMAISDKGDMNLYDFKKALRQDNRWQYTETAKKEVSSAALSVLRDFGFQG